MNTQTPEKRLISSMVPRHTFTTTLALSNFAVLADITSKKKFVNPDNQLRRNYYLEAQDAGAGMRRAVMATALFAKELCLSRESVCYATVGIFMRELAASLLPRETTVLNPIMNHVGKGYIVVPDFSGVLAMSELYTPREIRDFTDTLTQHLDAGGAMVLCGPKFEDVPSHAIGQALVSAIEDRFITVPVR